MNKLLYGLIAVVILLVALIANAPARLLILAIPASQIQLEGVSGTLWRGQVGRCRLALANGVFELGAVQWRLKPWSLLLLSPEVQLSSAWGRQQFDGELTISGAQDVTAREVNASFDASVLTALFPLAVDGAVSLQLAELDIRQGLPHSARGRIVWQQGRWLSPQGAKMLGSYALEMDSPDSGEGISGQVVTLAGPLQAKGRVELIARDYAVDIELHHEQGFEAQLANMLALMAEPVGDGYRVRMNGAL